MEPTAADQAIYQRHPTGSIGWPALQPAVQLMFHLLRAQQGLDLGQGALQLAPRCPIQPHGGELLSHGQPDIS